MWMLGLKGLKDETRHLLSSYCLQFHGTQLANGHFLKTNTSFKSDTWCWSGLAPGVVQENDRALFPLKDSWKCGFAIVDFHQSDCFLHRLIFFYHFKNYFSSYYSKFYKKDIGTKEKFTFCILINAWDSRSNVHSLLNVLFMT